MSIFNSKKFFPRLYPVIPLLNGEGKEREERGEGRRGEGKEREERGKGGEWGRVASWLLGDRWTPLV